jgi:pimeloyl-ACP methyl ester carboxylesterase
VERPEVSEKVPILFLHGAFAGPEIWTRFIAPWFAGRGHRTATPRLPGPTAEEPRLRDYVRQARRAADAFGQRPIVVGHSLGGLVAQHLAAEGRVAAAVLVASPGPFGLGPSIVQLATRAPDVLAAMLLLQAGSGALIGRETVRRALFTEDTPDDWIDSLGLLPHREPPTALLDGTTWDLPAWPLARRTPIFAIRGASDVFVPHSDLLTIRMLYGAQVETLPSLGHGLPVDPHWKSLAWLINAWLGDLPKPSPVEQRLPPRRWGTSWAGATASVA